MLSWLVRFSAKELDLDPAESLISLFFFAFVQVFLGPINYRRMIDMYNTAAKHLNDSIPEAFNYIPQNLLAGIVLVAVVDRSGSHRGTFHVS